SPTRIVPASGRSRPTSWETRVVLPAPLCPRRPTTSPARTCKDTSLLATTLPNDRVRPTTSRITSGIGSSSQILLVSEYRRYLRTIGMSTGYSVRMAPAPRSRQDQQQETRDTLVAAARAVFAETGYHAASLEAIARQAGYSKGAVYSNSAGKADLFLAVMDANMEAADIAGGWDLPAPNAEEAADCEPVPEQFDAMIEGMSLATLEF